MGILIGSENTFRPLKYKINMISSTNLKNKLSLGSTPLSKYCSQKPEVFSVSEIYSYFLGFFLKKFSWSRNHRLPSRECRPRGGPQLEKGEAPRPRGRPRPDQVPHGVPGSPSHPEDAPVRAGRSLFSWKSVPAKWGCCGVPLLSVLAAPPYNTGGTTTPGACRGNSSPNCVVIPFRREE